MDLAARQSAFAAALLDPMRPPPAGITSARGDSDAARFAVYRNNVVVSLVKALGARFPVVERLVGPEFFHGTARAFVIDERPSSPLLFEYGDGFPDFVAAFAPARKLPYLADVARIEAAWTRAYHARDATPIDAAALAARDGEGLAALRLAPHPAAALIASAHPAGSIWAAHQRQPVEPIGEWRAETVLVLRPGMEVSMRILPPRDAAFAAALLRGDRLGEAAQAAAEAGPDFDFGTALVGLVSAGAFTAILDGEERA